MVYLYTVSDLGSRPPGMTFELWSNDILSTTWQHEADNGALDPYVTYNSVSRRFEIKFPAGNLQANYLKVVIGNTAPEIDLAEINALMVIAGIPGVTGCADLP